MDSRKLERIVLIILVLLNIFLLSVVLSDAAQARRSAAETASHVTALLEENGITASAGAVKRQSAPAPYVLTRDSQRENEMVKKLIGEFVPEDIGGNIISYHGQKGQALLRGSGEMDALLQNGAVPLRGGEERTAFRLLRRIGIAAMTADPVQKGLDVYCTLENVPVYNAVLHFDFTTKCVEMVTGTRLFHTAVKRSEAEGMDSISVLLRFVEIVRSEGYICSRVDDVRPGYLMTVTRSGEAELQPVWRIETDTGPLMIDAESGKVANHLT